MKGSEGFPRAVFSIRGLIGLFCINRYAKEAAFCCLFLASNLTTTGAVILVRFVPMKSTKRLPRDVVTLNFLQYMPALVEETFQAVCFWFI